MKKICEHDYISANCLDDKISFDSIENVLVNEIDGL